MEKGHGSNRTLEKRVCISDGAGGMWSKANSTKGKLIMHGNQRAEPRLATAQVGKLTDWRQRRTLGIADA